MALAIATFLITYTLLVDGFYRRTLVVLFAAFFLLLTGVLTPLEAFRAVDWNVMAMFVGMLVLADLFLHSRMPAVLAAGIAARAKTVGMAVLGMCILASMLSMFLENVAVVLVLAPIALALARQLTARATPFLIGIALSSNLQGAAMLVGDPPSMILGTFANITFNDFFWYGGRPGIFFAVQVGAVASFALLWVMFRKFQTRVGDVPHDHARSLVPSFLLVGVIAALALGSFLWRGPYTAGMTVLVFAGVGWAWYKATLHTGLANHHRRSGEPTLTRLADRFRSIRDRFASPHRLIRNADWETTFFLLGAFVVVGSLSTTGAIAAFTEWFSGIAGASPLRAYVLIVVASVGLSAFIDNVPYVLAMLPVASGVAANIGMPPFLLYAGLLIGASVGGNITPIGASANIVAYRWIEERAKEPITFMGYVRYGLPFTIVAVFAATLFGWYAWR